jgi:hypothetical protein
MDGLDVRNCGWAILKFFKIAGILIQEEACRPNPKTYPIIGQGYTYSSIGYNTIANFGLVW